MQQSFRKIKIDINDKLYSKIIRYGQNRCIRCKKVRDLECAHIIGRGARAVRFLLFPKPNALYMCSDCHSWFDSHKIKAVVFEEEKRVFQPRDESYTYVVSLGYEWGDIQRFFVWGQGYSNYSVNKPLITRYLKGILKFLENGGDINAYKNTTHQIR